MSKKYKHFILSAILLIATGSLFAQNISLTFPNGNEHWINNTQAPHNIIWTSTGVDDVTIEYSDDNGSTWNTIATNIPNQNFYTWDVPIINTNEALIKISDSNTPAITDQSDVAFNISDQQIYFAEWNTSMGNFRALLHGDKTPITVQNFINLAERNFYDNLIFHRVIEGFMIQDGCPTGNGSGGPGYEFDNEIHSDLTHSFPGVLAMANAGPDTNGSQYYITVDETSWLDGDYSIFGRIIDGMENVFTISEVPTDGSDKPLTDIDIYSVDIVPYAPVLNLLSPSGSENILSGEPLSIEWNSEFTADVKIEYSIDGGATKQTITDSIPSSAGIYTWETPAVDSENCYVYITDINDPENTVENPTAFQIRAKPAIINRIEFFENVEAEETNPENLIGPGKIVRFKARVYNNYSETLSALSAELSCDNPDIMINQSTTTFSSINTTEQIWANSYFEFTLPENISEIEEIIFHIAIEDDNIDDIPWITEFYLPVLSKFNFYTIDDNDSGNSSGNGNGIFESGETIELTTPISNNSADTVYQVFGRLSSEHNFINVWNEIEGENGIVYNTTTFNNYDPIMPNSFMIQPNSTFVFDYNAENTYEFTMNLKIYAYMYQEEGTAWDNGGTAISYLITYVENESYPTEIQNTGNRQAQLNIYPTPAADQLKISCENFPQGKIDFKLFDLNGRCIKYFQTNENNSTVLDLTNIPQGIYILQVNHSQVTISEKIVIER